LRAAICFRLQAGDKFLEQHIQNSSANATYLSWKVQNEIISECGSLILQSIVSAVGHGEYAQKAPEFFSMLADETTVASGKEQFSISVRYLQDYKLHEDFLQFVEVTDFTGKGLANTLLSTV